MSKSPFDTNSIAKDIAALHNHVPPRVNHRSEPLAIMIIIWPYCMMSHPHNYHDSLINYSPGHCGKIKRRGMHLPETDDNQFRRCAIWNVTAFSGPGNKKVVNNSRWSDGPLQLSLRNATPRVA
ncbi:hypothetical protein CEXT_382841 [Caerostris extrusa]|uniref:Uncharacterized protein n=1 Tax=Caerostris extrusa TaxID=172846 RepID=A0AAV4M4M1_CAEEX|nr:hypothetical protein CEXT_382841 [Caerostris extrusa]